jgi:DNA repair protein RecO (recombination protein O)
MQSTRGILLRKRRLSETSSIVSWCTDSLGVIQTVARGARRPKSPFRGRLDLFFEAEVSIALSQKSNLHTLREVTVVNPFPGIRISHLRTQVAAYFVELVEICTEREHGEPQIFDLLRRAFGFLDRNEPDLRAVTHFEAELARINGVHDARRQNSAIVLGQLFGRLPRSRPTLMNALKNDRPGSAGKSVENLRNLGT